MTISCFPSLLDNLEIQRASAKPSCRIFSLCTDSQCILHKQLPTKVWPCHLCQVTSSSWSTFLHSQFGKIPKGGFKYRQLTIIVRLQEDKRDNILTLSSFTSKFLSLAVNQWNIRAIQFRDYLSWLWVRAENFIHQSPLHLDINRSFFISVTQGTATSPTWLLLMWKCSQVLFPIDLPWKR